MTLKVIAGSRENVAALTASVTPSIKPTAVPTEANAIFATL
jgi:hypothetical protein